MSAPTCAPPGTASWRRDLWWLLAYLPLSIAYTWPLGEHLSDRLAGNEGDSWQNLWNIVWLGRALGRGENPFFTHDLWQPDGITLVFQTFDLPDAVLAAPLARLLGPWAAYNGAVLWTFAASGMALFLLARGLGSSRPAAFLAGCLYTFSTYHFAHDSGHLHILAMQWVPLFVLALLRVLQAGRWRWAVGGGVLLALASFASWYYLVDAFLLSLPLAGAWLVADRAKAWKQVVPRALVLCGVYLALVAPLGLAMVRARGEPIGGEHPAWFFSADLESFVFPNAAQSLAALSSRWTHWTGNGAENGTYWGALLVIVCLAGLALRAPRVGRFLLAGLFGAVIALGPSLHVGGRIVTGDVLPYVWLGKVFPLLGFMGVPVRFGFCMTFALAAAAAPSLDALAQRFGWRLALPLGALALMEHVPHPFVTSAFPTPEPMRAWAKDTSDFTVIDASRDMRHLWHQVVHGHPIFCGYTTRTPERLEKKLTSDPVVGPLWAWEPPERTAPFHAEALDFPFAEPVVPGAERMHFSFKLHGSLQVPEDGRYVFRVLSDDGARLFVDGRLVLDDGGLHPPREAQGEVPLTAGAHEISIDYAQVEGGAVLRAEWGAEGGALRIVGGDDVPGGFTGEVRFRRRELRVPKEQALAHLRDLKVRYVVQMEQDSAYPLEEQLGLRPFWTGDGLRLYELPAR